MTVWSFEVQWPAPFKPDWQRSGQRLPSSDKAAEELGKFLAVSADNGCILLGRLVALKSDE